MDNLVLIILTSSLTSSLVTVLITRLFDLLAERKREKDEYYREFYGPLKMYLIIIDETRRHKNKIVEATSKRIIEKSELPDVQKTSNAGGKLTRPLLSKIWQYVDRIYHLIESNPDKIKPEHLPMFRQFIHAYITRQTVGTERPSSQEAVQQILSPEDVNVAEDEIIEVLETLKKEFIKDMENT